MLSINKVTVIELVSFILCYVNVIYKSCKTEKLYKNKIRRQVLKSNKNLVFTVATQNFVCEHFYEEYILLFYLLLV